MKREVAKYLVAGGLAFLCDMLILYLCTEFLGFHYLISNLFGYFFGLIIAYALNIHWVFTHRRYKKTWFEFVIFTLIVIVGLGISEVMLALLVDKSGLHYLEAKVFVGVTVMVFNYTAKKFILFRPSPIEEISGA